MPISKRTYYLTSPRTDKNDSLSCPVGTIEGEFDEDELNPLCEPKDLQQTAENIVGPVDWEDDSRGWCKCPGEDQHTTTTRANHSRVCTDGVSTIQCFHTSCEQTREAENRELRAKFSGVVNGALPTFTNPVRQRDTKRLSEIERQARIVLHDKIVPEYAWPEAGLASQIASVSPIAVPTDPAEQKRRFLGTVFGDQDIVWIGQKFDSGKPCHRRHFRPVENWLICQSIQGEFTCASTFKDGSQSRGLASVEQRRHIVIESDSLTRGQTAGVFQYLEAVLGWHLRAIIYSGKRSLHGWFDGPPLAQPVDELGAFVQGLNCDPATLRPCQPVRLPGALRSDTGNWQALLYLSPSSPTTEQNSIDDQPYADQPQQP